MFGQQRHEPRPVGASARGNIREDVHRLILLDEAHTSGRRRRMLKRGVPPVYAPPFVVRGDAVAEPPVYNAFGRPQYRHQIAVVIRRAQLALHHSRQQSTPAMRGQRAHIRYHRNRRSSALRYVHAQRIRHERPHHFSAVERRKRPAVLHRAYESIHRIARNAPPKRARRRSHECGIIVRPDEAQLSFPISHTPTRPMSVPHMRTAYPSVRCPTDPQPNRRDADARLSARKSLAAPFPARRPQSQCLCRARPE